MDNFDTIKFLNDQIENAPFRILAYIKNEKGKMNPQRSAFLKLRKHIENYSTNQDNVRWLIVPGLRGTGKTTLLAQLYNFVRNSKKSKFPPIFVSVDQLTRVIGSNINKLIDAYESVIGIRYEQLTSPVFIFLDEVQYDSNWALTLKSLYDRTKNAFIITTGSSALSLNSNPDVARRSNTEKIFPMSITEYFKIKCGQYEEKGLGGQLRDAIFNSETANEVYTKLQYLKPKVISYWDRCCKNRYEEEIFRYLEIGSLPYLLKIENDSMVYEQINKTLDKVISYDIPLIGKFKQDNIAKVPEILYLLASSDTISTIKLSSITGISRPILIELLNTIEKTDLITRIYPHGSHTEQVKKPSRYHFMSPAFRSMYFNYISSTVSKDIYKGKLLEDAIALYLTRLFYGKLGYSITLDPGLGGADFIVGIAKKDYIPIEVGMGEKPYRQVLKTMEKVKSKYGICVSLRPLDMDRTGNVVSIPLTYFLLT